MQTPIAWGIIFASASSIARKSSMKKAIGLWWTSTIIRWVPQLVPVLQYTIEITRDDLARLSWVPLHGQNRSVARLNFVPHLARLPVPEAHITATVARADELTVRTDRHIWRIPCHVVPSVALLPVLAESVGGGVYGDLIVGGLECNVFA